MILEEKIGHLPRCFKFSLFKLLLTYRRVFSLKFATTICFFKQIYLATGGMNNFNTVYLKAKNVNKFSFKICFPIILATVFLSKRKILVKCKNCFNF